MIGSQLSTYVNNRCLDLARRQGGLKHRKRSVPRVHEHFEHSANVRRNVPLRETPLNVSGPKAYSGFLGVAHELARSHFERASGELDYVSS